MDSTSLATTCIALWAATSRLSSSAIASGDACGGAGPTADTGGAAADSDAAVFSAVGDVAGACSEYAAGWAGGMATATEAALASAAACVFDIASAVVGAGGAGVSS